MVGDLTFPGHGPCRACRPAASGNGGAGGQHGSPHTQQRSAGGTRVSCTLAPPPAPRFPTHQLHPAMHGARAPAAAAVGARRPMAAAPGVCRPRRPSARPAPLRPLDAPHARKPSIARCVRVGGWGAGRGRGGVLAARGCRRCLRPSTRPPTHLTSPRHAYDRDVANRPVPPPPPPPPPRPPPPPPPPRAFLWLLWASAFGRRVSWDR